jgi:hypothetical protein
MGTYHHNTLGFPTRVYWLSAGIGVGGVLRWWHSTSSTIYITIFIYPYDLKTTMIISLKRRADDKWRLLLSLDGFIQGDDILYKKGITLDSEMWEAYGVHTRAEMNHSLPGLGVRLMRVLPDNELVAPEMNNQQLAFMNEGNYIHLLCQAVYTRRDVHLEEAIIDCLKTRCNLEPLTATAYNNPEQWQKECISILTKLLLVKE